ncbi:tripartite tricarboxylate transporter TctB family protein [Rhodopseudomonas pseudopalustris]|uniref:Putative tricarboxylic transport membrane protein n=1 Tax=Rhodopseudomonas pseudopalustris TaxID=1513892 RepID=A0A1H8QBM8_9BRAD|nr:tripartite tricarboxylate transporter TctB family protein [Rhodopseudomonas pseudopalustris]SEO51630.1 putative tricarboxylic transport membrane protein [Rhodopseudomonas pseudopalustris]
MSDAPSRFSEKSVFPKWIRGPQDFIGGLALVAVAAFALWAASDLQGMQGFSFGAGTAPRMFAVLLLVLGVVLTVSALLVDGEPMAKFQWRGPFFVGIAILSFAVSIRPLGLIISAFTSFMLAALGTPETRWKETIIVGVALTIGCSVLFPFALGLPMPLYPSFLNR